MTPFAGAANLMSSQQLRGEPMSLSLVFATSPGGVTERKNAVDASEDLARKRQELREMTRDLDLFRADVAVIAMMLRLRGAAAPTDMRSEEAPDSENKDEGA